MDRLGLPARAKSRGPDDLQWHIAARRSDMAKLSEGRAKQRLTEQEHTKASVRAKLLRSVPSHPAPGLPGEGEIPGLAKNTAHVFKLFALSNLRMARKGFDGDGGIVRPQTA